MFQVFGAAQYDKDAIIQIYTGAADEDKVFNVPSDVNMIKATLIGGGGAGGNSFYGKHEVITSRSWQVPAGVTKLRIFMLGGGGGGASGASAQVQQQFLRAAMGIRIKIF